MARSPSTCRRRSRTSTTAVRTCSRPRAARLRCISALRAAGVGPGDEVIVPAFTYVSTAIVAVYCGAEPVFADIDPETLTLSAATVEPLLSKRTRAIIPMHYAGPPADFEPIRELVAGRNITVVEDAAHAFGSIRNGQRVGANAEFAAFSFAPTKQIASSNGGILLYRDGERRTEINQLAFLGSRRRHLQPDRRQGRQPDPARRADRPQVQDRRPRGGGRVRQHRAAGGDRRAAERADRALLRPARGPGAGRAAAAPDQRPDLLVHHADPGAAGAPRRPARLPRRAQHRFDRALPEPARAAGVQGLPRRRADHRARDAARDQPAAAPEPRAERGRPDLRGGAQLPSTDRSLRRPLPAGGRSGTWRRGRARPHQGSSERAPPRGPQTREPRA